MNNTGTEFESLDALAEQMRTKLKDKKHPKLKDKKHLLLFAYNGIGKTRLSMAFKDVGKKNSVERDTLYFNAFTEDLFSWDNGTQITLDSGLDLDSGSHWDSDPQRSELRLNTRSRFFNGLEGMDMDNCIRPLLQRYADFDFRIDVQQWTISFSRNDTNYIKISRGEENIFIWCFFLAVAQLAIDEQDGYAWVKYLYIDDPVSSLDDNNAVAVASHLSHLLKKQDTVSTVISSHHTLFFNVLCNEFDKAGKYFLSKGEDADSYNLRGMYGDTAHFYHVAMLKELKQAADSGNLYNYHFNILRNILEKTSIFHGFKSFADCIKKDDDEDGKFHQRLINLLNHGGYSLFEPVEMLNENKVHFRKILDEFVKNHRFNPEIFAEPT